MYVPDEVESTELTLSRCQDERCFFGGRYLGMRAYVSLGRVHGSGLSSLYSIHARGHRPQ